MIHQKVRDDLFAMWRDGFIEERAKGKSEREIHAKVGEAIAIIERQQRGIQPDADVDDVIALLKEASMPADQGPGTVQ